MTVENSENSNKFISDLIKSEKPFSLIRLRSETDTLLYKGKYPKDIHPKYCNNGGLYPATKPILDLYSQYVHMGVKESDGIVYWEHLDYQYKAYKSFIQAPLLHFSSVEPFYFDDPWSQHLEGKKVLVIHPFSDSIKSQYKKREDIFDNKLILPEFDLITYKSVQSSADNTKEHSNWNESLTHMANEIKEIDFDIALIGCGCYDIPVSTLIKSLGKQSIIIGGGLQIMFGIKGNRWDIDPNVNKFYNEHWVRASDSEKPDKFDTVEKGCYW